jgi:hypothetical protein
VVQRYFAKSEVVVTGPVDVEGLGAVLRRASHVTASSEEVAGCLRARYPALYVSVASVAPCGLSASPLEPGELLLATRARRALGKLARAVLGSYEPSVRSWVSSLRSRLVKLRRLT